MSDHYDGKKFFNPTLKNVKNKSFFDLLRWQLSSEKKPWPKWIENTSTPRLDLSLSKKQAAFTFINHATVLIKLEGYTIITDPVFSQRTSPFSFVGPKRVRQTGVDIEKLPKIDLVLVSHNHYDHLDIESLKKLEQFHQPQFIVPIGDGKLLKSHKITRVLEMDWWDEFTINSSLKIVYTPSQHWSARSLFDRFASLWGAYLIISDNQKIYFAGDTGYATHFKDVVQKFGPMSFSMLPIGAYEPRWFMKDFHMNPSDAVQAHLDLQSKQSMGIHFGTWQLTDEGIEEPVKDLLKALDERGVSRTNFLTLEVGETLLHDFK